MRKLLILLILVLSLGIYYRVSNSHSQHPAGMPDMNAAVPVTVAPAQERAVVATCRA